MLKNKLIEIKHLDAGYENKIVIKDLSFCVFDTDFLCINGPNGSGKTTLIKAILGLLPIKNGEITFFRKGEKVSELNIGYLPQIAVIDRKFPISVYNVILSGLSGKKKWTRTFLSEERERVEETIRFIGLEEMKDQPIGNLSGGQLQRVLLARAIISSPEVLILDEPDTYMDRSFKEQLIDILKIINKETSIIVVSHQEKAFASLIKQTLYIEKDAVL